LFELQKNTKLVRESYTMLLSKIRIYLELMRFIVCLSASLMAIVGYWLSIHKFDFSNIDALLAAIAVGTALAFGNALNDILDVKGDMISYPDRPIPRGAVSVAEAGWVTAFFLMVSLVCGFLVGWPMLLFTIILLATAALYDLWVSKIPILGKVLVAAWIALTLATGYFVAEAGALPVIPIVAAFLFILAREFIERKT
jgi:geranylgeranylglycerol-phosphate geranylgeranyltransferase